MIDRILVGEMGSEMVNDFRSLLKRQTKILVACHIATKKTELGAVGNVPFVGLREVVENKNPLYVEECKSPNQVCTDGSCASGHQDRFPPKILGQVVQNQATRSYHSFIQSTVLRIPLSGVTFG